ncbi:DUF3710 domain-containing protein [Paramicrobacterium fandaimingii]|uniref:DUF3710 domain-containing protein n=1 Tax=Paramicrobacterium fandaimingii TaxID=2708079 RepID=UPI00141E437D|nr:DUF3710 domain-containing protein [Microbacterium fandaimingii]
MILRKKKSDAAVEPELDDDAAADEAEETDDVEEVEVDPAEKSAPADREENGPFDETEANPIRPYIDLGGVKILPREGLNLRLEVEESSQRIVAVGLDYADSTLQVQPFAAPRGRGLWHETRDQIRDQIDKQGGTTQDVDGPFGRELVASVPVAAQGDSSKTRDARFIGVDGPRWFLRGVVAGAGAREGNAADKIDDLFRSIVVVRGGQAMPPRDLIPLKMPEQPGQST